MVLRSIKRLNYSINIIIVFNTTSRTRRMCNIFQNFIYILTFVSILSLKRQKYSVLCVMSLPQLVRRNVDDHVSLVPPSVSHHLWAYKGPGFKSPGGLELFATNEAIHAHGMFSAAHWCHIKSRLQSAWIPLIAACSYICLLFSTYGIRSQTWQIYF